MKKILITGAAVTTVVAIAWAIPPVRKQLQGATQRFRDSYREREHALRAALMAESTPLVR